jgi:hypothetical protein
MRRFYGFRPDPPPAYLKLGHANPFDQPQYEGVEFDDGTVAVRWLTEYRSTSLWPDFETFEKVHGHADYSTEIRWLDD